MIYKGHIVLLDKGCTILGPFQELPSIEVGNIIIDQEALILTYTDGLTDICNKNGDFFTEKMVHQFAVENATLEVHAFNKKLLNEIDAFKGKENYSDDITILTCKIFFS